MANTDFRFNFGLSPLSAALEDAEKRHGTAFGLTGPVKPPGVARTPRGIRNNNPLNIEAGAFAARTPGFMGSDGRFAQFESPEAGVAAADRLLSVYGQKGINSISGVVNRWAPSSDGNDTGAYARFVSQKLGIEPDDPIDLFNPGVRRALVGAMAEFENGEAVDVGPDPAVASTLEEFERLNAEEPGRYVLADEADLPALQAEWEKKNRSTGLAGDTGRLLSIGFDGLALSVREGIRSIPKVGQPIVGAIDAVDQWMHGKSSEKILNDRIARAAATLTPGMAEAREKNWWDEEAGWFGPAAYDPRSYFAGAMESAPGTASMMLPALALARGAYVAKIAAGLSPKVASAAAARTALVAGGLIEGFQGGGETALGVRQQIEAMSEADLAGSEVLGALMEQGLSFEEARTALANDSATQAFAIGGVVTGVFGGVGDRVLTKILAEGVKGGVIKRVMRGFARGAVSEGLLEELPQSVGQQVAENIAMRGADPERPLTEGVGEAAVSGAAIGAVMGGPIGAGAGGARRATAEEAADLEEPPPTRATPGGPLEGALRAGEDAARTAPPTPPQIVTAEPPPGAPAPKEKVVVTLPEVAPFEATVESYTIDGEALVYDGSGEIYQVPMFALSSPDAAIAAAADAQREEIPPNEYGAEGEPARVTVTGFDRPERVLPEKVKSPLSADIRGKTANFPDDAHADLYDLGRKRDIQRRGSTPPGRVDVLLRDQRIRLAEQFGVDVSEINTLSDDYRHRVEKKGKKALGAEFDAQRLVRGVPTPEAEWWDGLTEGDRRTFLLSAGVKRSPKAPWKNLSATIQQKLLPYRDEPTRSETEPVDVAAAEAATSPANDLPEPTEDQKKAGNYQKGHDDVTLPGLSVSIENPAGSTRSGTDASGKPWSVTMKHHYGYIRRTEGKDGDQVDVFIKKGTAPLADDAPVFIVDQVKPGNGHFDEQKVMLGFKTVGAAKQGYLTNYAKGWKGLGAITQMSLADFKTWLKEGDTTKPAAAVDKAAASSDAVAEAPAQPEIPPDGGIDEGDTTAAPKRTDEDRRREAEEARAEDPRRRAIYERGPIETVEFGGRKKVSYKVEVYADGEGGFVADYGYDVPGFAGGGGPIGKTFPTRGAAIRSELERVRDRLDSSRVASGISEKALAGIKSALADLDKRLGAKPSAAAPKPKAEPKPAKPIAAATVSEASDDPQVALARVLMPIIQSGAKLTPKSLLNHAVRAFGGSSAQGKFTRKDAYDALELAVNMLVASDASLRVDDGNWQKPGKRLGKIVVNLPSQNVRTDEQISFQQFSTPPHFSAAAVYAANLRDGDVLLEPSAGTGSIVAAASRPGVSIVANELAERRVGALNALIGDRGRVFTENAEQINNILPKDVKPTVVVMNPPFSQTAGRLGDKKQIHTGAVHIEQALKRLESGGRLVAIVGRGMTMGAPKFRDWWKRISQEYAVRANIGVDGSVYAKYGTTFGTRLLVIDKIASTGERPVLADVQTVDDLMRALEPIRNGRPEQQPAQSSGAEATEGGGRVRAAGEPAPADAGGLGARGGRDGGLAGAESIPGGEPGRPADGVATGGRDGVAPVEPERGEPGGAGERPADSGDESGVTKTRGGVRAKRDVEPDAEPSAESAARGERVEVEAAAPGTQAATSAITESLYEPYQPQRVRVAGAKPHPGPLVQSAAMASVAPPAPTYSPTLPKNLITEGKLSLAQLEAVIYAGQAHQAMLPAPEGETARRRGHFIGDGTGVGKGREIAGIILDNWQQGRTRHVWVSEKKTLLEDAKRDWAGIDQTPNLIFDVGKTKAGAEIAAERGIAFTTYDTLKGGLADQAALARGSFIRKQRVTVDGAPGAVSKVVKGRRDEPTMVTVKLDSGDEITVDATEVKGEEGAAIKSRVDQIVEWLGEDFDGVIAFDEAHNMGNAITVKGDRGMEEAAQKALAGLHLQARLPNARVVYVSATGATEVANLAYADRLGLWGYGTPFAARANFINEVEGGGIAAMELVARDMKQMGLYTARSLSYDGVEYERVEHVLDAPQREIYDTLAEAWQTVLKNINEALTLTEGDKNRNAKSAAYSAFWGTHQRFFNQIVTSMQMPSVVKAVEADLKAGRQAVLQLTNTNEASQERAAAKAQSAEELEDLDITPRDSLIQLITRSFPTQQYETYLDEDGNERTRPVMDSEGNPVENAEAVAMREGLVDQVASVRVPQGPLDLILDHFGIDTVAEVTGRKRRFVLKENEHGDMRRREEARAGSANLSETEAFQSGKKRILVFSEAGGTGRSYHADNSAASKKARRAHYLVQAGWRADKAVQGFGRTHRTNQASAPIFRLVTTDLQGQKRFVSSIARRLAQLGALTKGQRQAGDQGLFSERDNLESREASLALERFFNDLFQKNVEGITIDDFEAQTGLALRERDKDGGVLGLKQQLPPITQFLNRLLSLKITMQNAVFDAFSERLDHVIETRRAAGNLDLGLETVRADKIAKQSEQIVHTMADSGAETRYVKLRLADRFKPKDFNLVAAGGFMGVAGWVKSPRGKVYGLFDASDFTDAGTGAIIPKYRLVGPVAESRLVARGTIDEQGAAWERITKEQARGLWKAETAAAPEFVERDMHLITGAILPIWDRLKGNPRVVRLQTDGGERFIGRVVPPGAIAGTLKALGAEGSAEKLDTPALFKRLMAGGRVTLANGWKLHRALVAGEHRIELTGVSTFSDGEAIEKEGLFSERINFARRYFVPTDEETGIKVLAALTQFRPVVETGQARAGPDEDIEELGSTLRRGPQRSGPSDSEAVDESKIPAGVFAKAPSGRFTFGMIGRSIAKAIRGLAAPIRVRIGSGDEGLKHIGRPERLAQFKQAGFATAEAFIADVAANYDAIHEGRQGSLFLVRRTKPSRVLVVKLTPDEAGNYYDVRTALVARSDFMKNKKLLWERAQTNQSDVAARPPSAISGQSSESDIGESEELGNIVSRLPATDTPAFKRWFGRSKVVDGEGKPLVVYHGTGADFSAFDDQYLGTSTKHPTAHLGFYFTPSSEVATDFMPNRWDLTTWPHRVDFGDGANIMPVYLSIKKPREIRWDQFRAMWRMSPEEVAEIQSQLFDAGYDGIHVTPMRGAKAAQEFSVDHWIAFRPEQIKSATGNRGTFDPEDASVIADTVQRAEPEVGTQPIQLDAQERAALEDAVARTVHRIFGSDIDLETPDIIANEAVGSPAYNAAMERVKESGGRIGDTAGGLARVDGDKLSAIVKVALADPHFDPLATASHEAYHAVEGLLMSEADFTAVQTPEAIDAMRKIVAKYLGVADTVVEKLPGYELRAIAFEAFDTARTAGKPVMGAVEGLPGVLARFFEKLRRLIRALRKALGEQGIRDWRDVFEDVSAGAMTTRPKVFRNLTEAEERAKAGGAELGSVIPRNKDELVDAVQGLAEDRRGAAYALLPLNYLVDFVRPGMQGISDYLAYKRQMDSYRGKRQNAAQAVVDRWRKVALRNPQGAKALADLMHRSTLLQVDPSKTDLETKEKDGYPSLRKAFTALPPAMKQLYTDVRDAYLEQSRELDDVIVENVRKSLDHAVKQAERDYEKTVTAIKDRGLVGKERDEELQKANLKRTTATSKAAFANKARITKLRQSFESNRMEGPYFPLGRFGQYFVTVRDLDGSVLDFSRFEKESDRRAFIRELKKDFPAAEISTGVLSNSTELRAGMSTSEIGGIVEMLQKAGVGDEIIDALWQRHLTTMPDLSIRKRFIHRKGTSGFHKDALRVFGSHMFHAAHQMGRLKFSPDLQEAIEETEEQAKKADKPVAAMKLVNELRLRHQHVMNPTSKAWATAATQIGFLWYLGATPAAAMVNLSQTTIMGIPILGSRFGMARSAAALGKALGDFTKGKGTVLKAGITADEKRAMEALYDSGALDRTRALDLAGIAEQGMEYSPMRAKVMEKIAWMFHNAERLNREVTALAAYRMARASGEGYELAIKTAGDLTWRTHFDYSAEARPRIMQGGGPLGDAPRVMLQFRNYQINVLYRIGRDLHQMFKGESPQARKEARYQFAGIMGMMALHAGAMGTPLIAWVVLPVLGMLRAELGDDDPMTTEEKFRKDVLDVLGPQLGGIALDGVPGYALGINLTDRIGLPDIWFRNDDRNKTGVEWWKDRVVDMAGPGIGIITAGFDGWGVIQDGKGFARGIETAAPKFVKDAMKAWRFGLSEVVGIPGQGVTNRKGDPVVPREDIELWTLLSQLTGFTPAKVAEQYRANSAKKNQEEIIYGRRKAILDAFARARSDRDTDALADIREQIKEFNASPFHKAVRITPDTIKRSMQTRERLKKKIEGGVLVQNPALNRQLNRSLPESIY
jgi:predicted RNA methylase